MYHASIYQECIYDSVDGLDYSSSKDCEKSFLDCCKSFSETKYCTKGITQALNASFCPYISWTSPTAKDRVGRTCCESCLRGLNDHKSEDKICSKQITDFATSMEFNAYSDCCNQRISSFANELSKHEKEEAESEVIIDRRSQSISGSRAQQQRRLELGADKTCQELNHCAHFCIDATLSIPKHCTCRAGYFLGEDGGSCMRTTLRYTSFRTGSDPCIVVPPTPSVASSQGISTSSHEDITRTHKTKTEITELHSPQSCKTGFAWDRSHHTCVDIDECALGSNPCFSDQTCINFDGGYYCRQNTVTAAPSPVFRSGPSSRNCESGLTFSFERGYCVDEDECAKGFHNCKDNQICRNTYRNFTCDCIKGYQRELSGNCIDIDECRDHHYQLCPSYESVCLNTPGSYRCLCKDGFSAAPGESCVDADECTANPGICGPNGVCVNTHGSFKCRCASGFRLAADGVTCEDIDECASGLRMCVGQCVNVPGSFRCSCPSGFRLDRTQRICEDIDECTESNPCHGGETCLNMMGDRRCYRVDCPDGYYKDPAKPNRCVKRLIKQVYDQQRQTVRFEDNQPHYITYNHLTLACNLSDTTRSFYDFSFDSTNNDYIFQVDVVDVKAPPGVPVATNSNFEVFRKGRNGASIYVTRPLVGPQDIELHFKVLNRDGDIFYKAVLNIYVSKYDGVHF